MKTEIKIGSKVVCPVTDADGETAMEVGTLVDLNKRYAKVDLDGTVISVGKTKIEPFEAKPPVKTKKAEKHVCPECGAAAEDCTNHSELKATGDEGLSEYFYYCENCDVEFGPEIKEVKIPTDRYEYQRVVSASGNSSRDNGDDIATQLRGKTLHEVYAIAAKALGVEVADLQARYSHLNVGHQRMCIGNALRRKK